jgi:hypothetical protein
VNSYQNRGLIKTVDYLVSPTKKTNSKRLIRYLRSHPTWTTVLPLLPVDLYGYSVDLDQQAGKDYELIRKYRCMAMHPEIDQAIESIVNEAIVSDTNDQPVSIDLSNLDVSERIKTIIREEFSYILTLIRL